MPDTNQRRPWQFSMATLMLFCVIVGMGAVIVVQQLSRRARDQHWQQRLNAAREDEALQQQNRWSADIACLFIRSITEQDYIAAQSLLFQAELEHTPYHKDAITPEELRDNVQRWLEEHGHGGVRLGQPTIYGGHGHRREDNSIVYSFELSEDQWASEWFISCHVLVRHVGVLGVRGLSNVGLGSGWRVDDVFWKSKDEDRQVPHTWGTSILTGELHQLTAAERKELLQERGRSE